MRKSGGKTEWKKRWLNGSKKKNAMEENHMLIRWKIKYSVVLSDLHNASIFGLLIQLTQLKYLLKKMELLLARKITITNDRSQKKY